MTDDRMETITDRALIRDSDEPDERATPAPVGAAVALDLDAAHVRTDPACTFHDGATPKASRGKSCPACMRLDLDALHETICDKFTGMAEVRQAADLLVAEVRRLAGTHLLALVESLTAERDAAIAWRVEANRVHAARVESLREEFGKREDSQDRIRERLSAEVDRLRATVARCERLADSWTDRGWDSPLAAHWAQLHGAVFNPVGDLRAALAEPTGQEGDQ